MLPPHGVVLVGYEEGRPIAIGGVRRLQDGIREIKGMYVVPGARSRTPGVRCSRREALTAARPADMNAHASVEHRQRCSGSREAPS